MRPLREQLRPGVAFREARVQGNTIQGVAVLTPLSQNRRRYTAQARQDGADAINEGRIQSFVDHGDHERSVRDLVGVFRRGRVDGEGTVRADLKLLDTDLRPLLLSAAEEEPGALGLSINAHGQVRRDDTSRQVVEAIDRLNSVDVVARPASTSGLFEALRESGGKQRQVSDGELQQAAARIFGEGPTRRRRSFRPPSSADMYQAANRLFS